MMGLLYEMARAQMEDFPDTQLEQAEMLKNIMIARATGSFPSEAHYKALRQVLMEETSAKPLLPEFVRTCRSLSEFWGYIKGQSGSYQGRREHIYAAFQPFSTSSKAPAGPRRMQLSRTLSNPSTARASMPFGRRHWLDASGTRKERLPAPGRC